MRMGRRQMSHLTNLDRGSLIHAFTSGRSGLGRIEPELGPDRTRDCLDCLPSGERGAGLLALRTWGRTFLQGGVTNV